MVAEDKPAVMGIMKATPEFNELDVRISEDVVDSYLLDPIDSGYNNLVAEAKGKVLGFVSYGQTPLTRGTWDVYWIAVSPEEKEQGIGTAMLYAAEEAIRSAGGYLILIETSGTPEYENTRRFYEKRGYREGCRIRDFYAPGDDQVTMEKRFR